MKRNPTMMIFRVESADAQDNDDALIFDTIYEDTNPIFKDSIELEFSDNNLAFDLQKLAVGIINQQSGHAHCKTIAIPKGPG